MNNLLSRGACLAAVALCTLATSCVTTIPVRSRQPGPVAIGAADQLTLVKGEGRRSAREVVVQEVQQQARANGYFTVQDRSEDPIFVRVAGGHVTIDDQAKQLNGDSVRGVKIDVLEWNGSQGTRDVESKDAKGKVTTQRVDVQVGKVLLAVTLFDTQGRAYLGETEYEGTFETQDMKTARDDVVAAAARAAVARLMHDITPVEVVTRVRLDDDDEGQQAIVATAKAGNLAQAARDARTYVEANPNTPSAAYNLAVLLDAMGSYEEALAYYDQALGGSNKDYYTAARAECARRMGNAQAVGAQPAR
ncbi:MAG: tetratricopeptide repeat protein [Planctomycetota bacterium]